MNQNKDRVAPFTAVVPSGFRAMPWRGIGFACIAMMAMKVGAAPAQVASPAPAVVAPVALAATPGSVPDTLQQRLLACTGCHGNEGRAASDGFYPRIAGKPEGYLYNQLLNFREGRRHFQLMSYMVDYQSDDY
ncbi:MAG: cytochrome c family protein, partial [Nevskia sp.]|nr:cytochrome c family protein [Nevskia sp.]